MSDIRRTSLLELAQRLEAENKALKAQVERMRKLLRCVVFDLNRHDSDIYGASLSNQTVSAIREYEAALSHEAGRDKKEGATPG